MSWTILKFGAFMTIKAGIKFTPYFIDKTHDFSGFSRKLIHMGEGSDNTLRDHIYYIASEKSEILNK